MPEGEEEIICINPIFFLSFFSTFRVKHRYGYAFIAGLYYALTIILRRLVKFFVLIIYVYINYLFFIRYAVRVAYYEYNISVVGSRHTNIITPCVINRISHSPYRSGARPAWIDQSNDTAGLQKLFSRYEKPFRTAATVVLNTARQSWAVRCSRRKSTPYVPVVVEVVVCAVLPSTPFVRAIVSLHCGRRRCCRCCERPCRHTLVSGVSGRRVRPCGSVPTQSPFAVRSTCTVRNFVLLVFCFTCWVSSIQTVVAGRRIWPIIMSCNHVHWNTFKFLNHDL